MANRKTYAELRADAQARYPSGQTPGGVTVDDIVQLKLQNTFDTHLDIARAMAKVMREDMAAYDADPTLSTQSLGACAAPPSAPMSICRAGWSRAFATVGATCRTSRCTKRPPSRI
jgi:isocitrate lyase